MLYKRLGGQIIFAKSAHRVKTVEIITKSAYASFKSHRACALF